MTPKTQYTILKYEVWVISGANTMFNAYNQISGADSFVFLKLLFKWIWDSLTLLSPLSLRTRSPEVEEDTAVTEKRLSKSYEILNSIWKHHYEFLFFFCVYKYLLYLNTKKLRNSDQLGRKSIKIIVLKYFTFLTRRNQGLEKWLTLHLGQ